MARAPARLMLDSRARPSLQRQDSLYSMDGSRAAEFDATHPIDAPGTAVPRRSCRRSSAARQLSPSASRARISPGQLAQQSAPPDSSPFYQVDEALSKKWKAPRSDSSGERQSGDRHRARSLQRRHAGQKRPGKYRVAGLWAYRAVHRRRAALRLSQRSAQSRPQRPAFPLEEIAESPRLLLSLG